MYIDKSWKKVYKWMFIWAVVTVLAFISLLALSQYAFTGPMSHSKSPMSTISILVMAVLTATSIVILLFKVVPYYKAAVDLVTQSSDDILRFYGDINARNILLEPLIHRKRKLAEASYERGDDGWILTIQNLEIRFVIDDLNGRVLALGVLHKPSGDKFESKPFPSKNTQYYTVYWDNIVVGCMDLRTAEALWHLANEPFEYWRIRNGH